VRIFAQQDGQVRFELIDPIPLSRSVELEWWPLEDPSDVREVRKFSFDGSKILIRRPEVIDWDSPVVVRATQISRFLKKRASSTIAFTLLAPKKNETGIVWGECVHFVNQASRMTVRWRWAQPLTSQSVYKLVAKSQGEGGGILAETEVPLESSAATVNFKRRHIDSGHEELNVRLALSSGKGAPKTLATYAVEIPQAKL
jgi:hypothetical protein